MSKKQINRIKVVLAERGKTNRWLANALDKNETTVSRWCTNDAQPPLETLSKIADVLDVEITDLLQKSNQKS